MGWQPNGPTGRVRWRRRLFAGPVFEREHRTGGRVLTWFRSTPNDVQLAIGHLLERLDGDLGWDAAECILDQIFPDRGEGPFSSLGRTMSPNAWRTTIKKGLKDAFQRLANGDLS